jgi:hypothetical protein
MVRLGTQTEAMQREMMRQRLLNPLQSLDVSDIMRVRPVAATAARRRLLGQDPSRVSGATDQMV